MDTAAPANASCQGSSGHTSTRGSEESVPQGNDDAGQQSDGMRATPPRCEEGGAAAVKYERWVSESGGTLPQEILGHSSLQLTSLKQARRIIEKGCCSVNGFIAHIASKRVVPGDSIEVYPLDEMWQQEPCSILFEDDSLLIVNKPAGLAVEELHLQAMFSEKALFLVHRLDKWTSGVLLIAKNKSVQNVLEAFFRRREVKKEYLALVDGNVLSERGKVDCPIEIKKRRGAEVVCGVAKDGKFDATTYYKVILRSKKESLIVASPKTGRTHQIRVHLSSIGHPILGDYLYTSSLRSMQRPYRPMLHAWRILFRHPVSHRMMSFKAPLPSDFQKVAVVLFGDCFGEALCGL